MFLLFQISLLLSLCQYHHAPYLRPEIEIMECPSGSYSWCYFGPTISYLFYHNILNIINNTIKFKTVAGNKITTSHVDAIHSLKSHTGYLFFIWWKPNREVVLIICKGKHYPGNFLAELHHVCTVVPGNVPLRVSSTSPFVNNRHVASPQLITK